MVMAITNKYKNKKGLRTIGGVSHCYDSKGEANLARVLETQKQAGYIQEWQRECVFDMNLPGNNTKYRKNVVDFKTIENDGSVVCYEYKGFMDASSYMRLKTTVNFYPQARIVVVAARLPKKGTARRRFERLAKAGVQIREAREMFNGYSQMIPDWE